MTHEQLMKNLEVPRHPIDVVLDTDTFNETDDQFALSYLLRSSDKLKLKGICAAPFHNELSSGPEDGMEKSYQEIFRLLKLAECEALSSVVFRGSPVYLPDEKTPVSSPAARFMADLSMHYSPEKPLYIVAIGAITNVASALLLRPEMAKNTVIVWLGGHAHHMPRTDEFNMVQDIAAARVVLASGAPVVQLPCLGVVERFSASRWEMEHWLKGKNALCDYLLKTFVDAGESYGAGTAWSRVIWDVTAVGWLLNDNNRFMASDIRPVRLPDYNSLYEADRPDLPIRYVYQIYRDDLFDDLFRKLAK